MAAFREEAGALRPDRMADRVRQARACQGRCPASSTASSGTAVPETGSPYGTLPARQAALTLAERPAPAHL